MGKDKILLPPNPLEFYPTPDPFTAWLFSWMDEVYGLPISGDIYEPCVGDGAIIRAAPEGHRWRTNDLDPRWAADTHFDATKPEAWKYDVDWTVSNPPFEPALEIIEQALQRSQVGVVMHLRASIHEVLKTGKRRTWMCERTPTGILWLPRFAYQRSPTTGDWTTDSVTACWVIWLKQDNPQQFIDYAPSCVLDDLKAFTPTYRARMDALMAEYHKLAEIA